MAKPARLRFQLSRTGLEAAKRDSGPLMVAAIEGVSRQIASKWRVLTPVGRSPIHGSALRIHTRSEKSADGATGVVYSEDIAAHMIEWGSRNGPAPSHPAQRAVRSLGLKFKEEGK